MATAKEQLEDLFTRCLREVRAKEHPEALAARRDALMRALTSPRGMLEELQPPRLVRIPLPHIELLHNMTHIVSPDMTMPIFLDAVFSIIQIHTHTFDFFKKST